MDDELIARVPKPRPSYVILAEALCGLPEEIAPGWLDKPRDDLRGRTPLRAIAEGDERAVLALCRRLRAGGGPGDG